MVDDEARRSDSSRSGGRSIGPATRSASASSATVPPLTTNWISDPPTTNTSPDGDERRQRDRAGRQRREDRRDDVAHVAAQQLGQAVSRSSATRNAPPTIGTASSSLTLESVTKPTMTSGQLAAAISAPRFKAAFSPGVCAVTTTNYSRYVVYPAGRGGPDVDWPWRADRANAASACRASSPAAAPSQRSCAGRRRDRAVAFRHQRRGGRRPRRAGRARGVRRDDGRRRAAGARGGATIRASPRRWPRASRPTIGIRILFDAAARARASCPRAALSSASRSTTRIGGARGWAGRASDLPRERPAAGPLFVAPSPLGLRLVYLEPIVAATPDRSRLGSVAVEHVLTPVRAGSLLLTTERVRDADASGARPAAAARPRALRPRPRESGFVIAAPDGTPLVDASIRPANWRPVAPGCAGPSARSPSPLLAVTVLLLAGTAARRPYGRARRRGASCG